MCIRDRTPTPSPTSTPIPTNTPIVTPSPTPTPTPTPIPTSKPITVNLSVNADTYISSTASTKNYGKSTYIYVDAGRIGSVSYTHLRAHETRHDLVCRLLLEK